MLRITSLVASSIGAALVGANASAAIIITQSVAPAPSYSVALGLNESGQQTGLVPSTYWSPLGVSIGSGVDLNNIGVGDLSGMFPWITAGNVLDGAFGVFFNFSTPITAMSFQAWDPSGPPSPFGGGMAVAVVDANENVLAIEVFTPAWGGIGATWYNIEATAGESFFDVRILPFGFPNTSYVGDVTWNAVPAPGALALLALGGISRRRRRGAR